MQFPVLGAGYELPAKFFCFADKAAHAVLAYVGKNIRANDTHPAPGTFGPRSDGGDLFLCPGSQVGWAGESVSATVLAITVRTLQRRRAVGIHLLGDGSEGPGQGGSVLPDMESRIQWIGRVGRPDLAGEKKAELLLQLTNFRAGHKVSVGLKIPELRPFLVAKAN